VAEQIENASAGSFMVLRMIPVQMGA